MKVKKVVIWILIAVNAAIFLLAGSGKFQLKGVMYENFIRWGYNGTLMIITGLMEIGGSVLLVIPKTKILGSITLIGIMIGASITHFLHYHEMGFPIFSISLILSLITIVLLNKNIQKND